MTLNFNNTTLVMVDGNGSDYFINEKIISDMVKIAKFKNILHFTTQIECHSFYSKLIKIKKLSYGEYQNFLLYQVNDYIDTDFAFFMQSDGFIINPQFFNPSFFDYDYIGAPWPKNIFKKYKVETDIVGNGGFSIRSKKLLNLCKNIPRGDYFYWHEDTLISLYYKNHFEGAGCRFAPIELASQFSIENPLNKDHIIENCFGFHGKGYISKANDILNKNLCILQ
jgi:hypothetical protein